MRFSLLFAVLVSTVPFLQALSSDGCYKIRALKETFGSLVTIVNVDDLPGSVSAVGIMGGSGGSSDDSEAVSRGEEVFTVYYGSNKDKVKGLCSRPNSIGFMERADASSGVKILVYAEGKGFLQSFGDSRRGGALVFSGEETAFNEFSFSPEKIVQAYFSIPDEKVLEVMVAATLPEYFSRHVGNDCIAVYNAHTISASTLPSPKKVVANGSEQQQIKVFYGFDECTVKAALSACAALRFPKIGIIIQRLTDDDNARECWRPDSLPADVFWNMVNPEKTGFIPLGARTDSFRLILRSASFDDVGFLILRPATQREKDWLASEDFTYVALNDSSNYENIISAKRLFTRKGLLIETIQVIYGWKR